MSNSESCAVALYRECNHATHPSINATPHATNNATQDLFALSAMVLERNQRNQIRNSCATEQLRCNEISATQLKHLIEVVGKHYKATNEEVAEMFENTLQFYSLEIALRTFRSLVEKIHFIPCMAS